MTDDLTTLDHSSSAQHTIRGFLTQAWVSVLRWIDLEEDQRLVLECREDLAILREDGITFEQVKDRAAKLTLATALDTLVHHARYLIETLDQREHFPNLVFSATASRGNQQLRDEEVDAIRDWSNPDLQTQVIETLRSRFAKKDANLAKSLDDHDLWVPLLHSVRWEPDLPNQRALEDRATESIQNRFESPAPGLLGPALLTRVLQASSKPNLKDRVLTRSDLDSLAHQVRDESLTARERAVERVVQELRDWTRALPDLPDLPDLLDQKLTADRDKTAQSRLDSGAREYRHDDSGHLPSRILKAAYQIVGFMGRQGELETLASLCEFDGPNRACLFWGPGGSGKTRLLIEFVRRIRNESGFVAGFLRDESSDDRLDVLFTPGAPRLLVLDYAEDRPTLVRRVLDRVANSENKSVHVVLLSRAEPRWLDELAKQEPAILDWVPAKQRRQLPALGLPRRDVYTSSLTDYAHRLGMPECPETTTPDLKASFYGRVLYIQMLALLHVAQARPANGTGEPTSPDKLLREVLQLESRHWEAALRDAGLHRDNITECIKPIRRSLAMSTLVGGVLTREDLRSWLRSCGLQTSIDNESLVTRCLERLYPTDAPSSDSCGTRRYLGPVEPDILGEFLVLGLWNRGSGGSRITSAIRTTGASGIRFAATTLIRAISRDSDYSDPAEATKCLGHVFEHHFDLLLKAKIWLDPDFNKAMLASPRAKEVISSLIRTHGHIVHSSFNQSLSILSQHTSRGSDGTEDFSRMN